MMDKFKKLLMEKAKSGDFMSDKEQKVKSEMLDAIKDIMNESGAKELKNLKKVTVASDSPEGLKKGLEQAKEVVEPAAEVEEEEECEDEMPMDKDAKIAELKAQLAMLEAE